MKTLAMALLLLLATISMAQEPWSAVWLDGVGGAYRGPVQQGNGMVVQFAYADRTEVVIVATEAVRSVLLVKDGDGNGSVLYPHLMGLMISDVWLAARSEWDWQGDEAPDWTFPGQAFAPVIAHVGINRTTMVADVDLRPCRPLYTRNRLALRYELGLRKGDVVVLRAMVAVDAGEWRGGVRRLVDRFHGHWRDDHEYDPELVELHGQIDVQLQDMADPIRQTMALLSLAEAAPYGKATLWGWTSDRFDPARSDTGCCLLRQDAHPRLGVFTQFLQAIELLGKAPALYWNADDPLLADALRLTPWGLAYDRYVDVAGFRSTVRDTYGPRTVIEGVSAANVDAGLISGCVTGGAERLPGKSRTHERPAPWFGRLLFDRRPLFLGGENYDLAWTTEASGFRTYRAAHLLGAKLSVRDPRPAILGRIIEQRDGVGWWSRGPAYRDLEGVEFLPAGATATTWLCADGTHLLAYDTWESDGGTARVAWPQSGREVTLPARTVGVIDLSRN